MTQQADMEIARDLRMFGRNLCAARERVSPDQHAFAKLAGFDRSTISKVECGKQAPNFDTFLALARAADVTPADLLSGVGLTQSPYGTPSNRGTPPLIAATQFGANLKWTREQAGLSHEDLGDEADADRSLISDWEHGKREANLRTILKLARALGVPAALLLHEVEPPPPSTAARCATSEV
jgi:transcriptional regulator with XRE-family HTH domain